MENTPPSLARFLLHLFKGRWIVVAVSFYIMSFAGATYIFGIYSGSIKTALGYDQSTIDTLSFFKDLGANVGILSGLLNEVMPSWVVLAVGAVMNMFGYLMIWLAVTKRISRPPIWQMYLYMCMGANSQTFANTGVLVTCVKNFPQSRGVVLGLLKGFVGLSGAIFTQVYHALYGEDTRGVILLVGWLPSLVSLLFMFFIRPMTPRMTESEGKYFFSYLYLALLLAGFLTIAIIVENLVPMSSAAFKTIGALTILLVVTNVWIAVQAELEEFAQKRQIVSNGHVQEAAKMSESNDKKTNDSPSAAQGMIAPSTPSNLNTSEGDKLPLESQNQTEYSPHASPHHPPTSNLLQESATHHPPTANILKSSPTHHPHTSNLINPSPEAPYQLATPEIIAKKSFFSNWPKRGDDFTIPQALISLDMWILFVATTAGVGATLTAIDNMGQIGASQGYSQISITTFVSLISIWNFLGRVIAGFSSEMLLQRYRFPRTLVLTIVLALACMGHLLIAFPAPGSLYIASILIGLCFGAQWPVLFAVISELFGLKYYATLYNLGAVASPLGSYLLNVRVAGHLYDKEARKQHVQLLSSTAMAPGTHAPSPGMSIIKSSDLSCYGPQCFRMTFLIMTAVSLFGSLVSVILVLRTRKFYSEDIYAKFRAKEDAVDKESHVQL